MVRWALASASIDEGAACSVAGDFSTPVPVASLSSKMLAAATAGDGQR